MTLEPVLTTTSKMNFGADRGGHDHRESDGGSQSTRKSGRTSVESTKLFKEVTLKYEENQEIFKLIKKGLVCYVRGQVSKKGTIYTVDHEKKTVTILWDGNLPPPSLYNFKFNDLVIKFKWDEYEAADAKFKALKVAEIAPARTQNGEDEGSFEMVTTRLLAFLRYSFNIVIVFKI